MSDVKEKWEWGLERSEGPKIPSKVYQQPSSNQILIYGYIRDKETVLQNGLYLPYYLKDIIVAYGTSNTVIFYLPPRNADYLYK